jgi:hypothetical protein
VSAFDNQVVKSDWSLFTFIELYAYTRPGQTSGKRLQTQEMFDYYNNNTHVTGTQTLNLDGAYTYDNEGKMTSVNYPTTYS